MRVKTLLQGGATVASAAALLLTATGAHAKVTQIVIDRVTPGPTNNLIASYEAWTGRAFGELDPTDVHNQIITDGLLGRSSDGKLHYVASFLLVKPKSLASASGFLWHDVPNRGGRITIATAEQNLGDIGLSSAWQGDNAGGTSVPPLVVATAPGPQATLGGTGAAGTATSNNEWVIVPVAVNADGSTITGYIQARIVNRSGPASQPLNVMGNPIPYLPASLDTTQAILRTRTHETIDGHISEGTTIPSSDWAFAHCTSWAAQTPQDENPADLPGSLPVHVCLKNGFDANTLYELVYPVKNPYVLGVGFAAFRDVNSFFRYGTAADGNPLAGVVNWSAVRGVSQSGNFTRAYIHLGFNQDESNRQVHDGAWPIIAGRRVSLDSRWAQPDGVLELYQMGSEGPQWWVDWPDHVRHLPTRGILDRCNATNTCPKVIEHFGGSEVFALKMTTEWVGTAADADIPLPDNVRRYYVPSTTHGGGGGATTQNSSTNPANCPGNNWGPSGMRANPVSEAQLVNVLRLGMRNWVSNGVLNQGPPPPPSRWPRLANHTLVDPTPEAMKFPKGIPSIPETIFKAANFVNPVFEYEWGPFFNETDATGVPTDFPPRIEKVIKMKVPATDSDGNELGGVPTTQREAPLGTYLGWNVTVGGFHEGQVCNYVGGLVPFATTKAQRTGPDTNVRFRVSANGKGGQWSHPEAVAKDSRPSLEERYGTHAGYVAAVTAAANDATAQGYLLAADRDALIAQAQGSDVLNSPTNTSLPAFGEIGIENRGGGDIKVHAGDTVLVGYSLSLPGKHAAATITFAQTVATLPVECEGHHEHHRERRTQMSVNIPNASLAVAQDSSAWVANADFAVTMPDLCAGGTMELEEGATFTATVGQQ